MAAIEAASRRLALAAFSRMRGGSLELIEPDGRRFQFGDAAADLAATIRVNSVRFYRSLLSGSVGLGESYRDRLWDCDDLVALLRIACRSLSSAASMISARPTGTSRIFSPRSNVACAA